MRYVYLANGKLGCDVLEWLCSQEHRPVALVVHPEARAPRREELVRLSGLPSELIFEGTRLREADTLDAIHRLSPDLGLSVLFGYILSANVLSIFPRGCLNLHPAWLPFNRGAYPNVWSLVEGTPAGATLHYIDIGVDTGDIVAQRRIDVAPTDTGASLYSKLEHVGLELFRETWPHVVAGTASRYPQPNGEGSFHRVFDVAAIDAIDLARQYRAGDLINILRARTFPPFRGAYFVHEGRRIYLELSLTEEKDVS